MNPSDQILQFENLIRLKINIADGFPELITTDFKQAIWRAFAHVAPTAKVNLLIS